MTNKSQVDNLPAAGLSKIYILTRVGDLIVSEGLFITVEGGEGVGKTLFTKMLTDQLIAAGTQVKTTREPGGTPAAQAIRELFLNPPKEESLEALTELFLVSAARHQHVTRLIKPALNSGQWVLCDRFVDSSRVYQSIVGGCERANLETVAKLSVAECEPDLTLLLDCSVDVSLDRLSRRGGEGQLQNRYDAASMAFHKRLREGFLQLADEFPDRIEILDASQDARVVVNQAYNIIKEKFGKRFD